jgi:DNA-binding HxlR family transcriptional regulator
MKKRQYDQYCPVACALDVVGERWGLLVVRELLAGPKRFVDLEAGLPGIGTNTLTTRLEELERGGVIAKRRLPAPSASVVYELTGWGRDLEPIVWAIARWGHRRLATVTPLHPLRASWLATALQAFFRKEAVRDLSALIELILPTGTLGLQFRRGNLSVREGPVEGPALRVFTTEQGFLELVGGGPLRSSRRKRDLRIEGDESLIERLVEAFPLRVDRLDETLGSAGALRGSAGR